MKDRKKLEQDFTQSLQNQNIPYGFIKVTDNPVGGLTSEQKVILNRKANTFFNNGNVEDARRIWIHSYHWWEENRDKYPRVYYGRSLDFKDDILGEVK